MRIEAGRRMVDRGNEEGFIFWKIGALLAKMGVVFRHHGVGATMVPTAAELNGKR
jgi:hypothetical protein